MSCTSTKRVIRVVAAEIRNELGQYLITQRLPHAGMPLLWEFPGGKVEPDETDEAALIREIREELDVAIEIVSKSVSLRREYEPYTIDFHSFSAPNLPSTGLLKVSLTGAMLIKGSIN